MRRKMLLLAALLIPASLTFAQWQVNPQVYTGIYAGPGPTSIRYAGEYKGANTVFNVSSRSANTVQGYATTGVYAPNPVAQGGSPVNQGFRVIPESVGTAQVTSPPPYGANQINAQVSGQINGSAY